MNEQTLKDRLRSISKEKNIKFNVCWKQLLLERFLVRLTRSSQADKFIFKGGMLLSYIFKIGRETIDLDFLLNRMKGEEKELRASFQEIISVKSEDGFAFSIDDIALLSQPHMNYPGYRVSLRVKLGKMQDKIQIDLGIGDVVEPESVTINSLEYHGNPLLAGIISLLAYPIETIFAEKLETVLSKGESNTRMKDYHDLFLLSRDQAPLNCQKLQTSLTNTFLNRKTNLHLIGFDERQMQRLAIQWKRHIGSLGNMAQELKLPVDFKEIVDTINCYLRTLPMIDLQIPGVYSETT